MAVVGWSRGLDQGLFGFDQRQVHLQVGPGQRAAGTGVAAGGGGDSGGLRPPFQADQQQRRQGGHGGEDEHPGKGSPEGGGLGGGRVAGLVQVALQHHRQD